MRQWKKHPVVKQIAVVTILVTTAFQVAGPVLAAGPIRKPVAHHVSELPKGLTDTPDAALRKKIAAKEAAAHIQPDVRKLTKAEAEGLRGRGPHRNRYFAGTLPWQKSFRDVNLCNGNLFKSFTDVQVSPARGAGLALQRTYNSNDDRIGPFGVGWTQAYDIRIEEEGYSYGGGTTGNTTGYPGTTTGNTTGYTTGYPTTDSTTTTGSTTGYPSTDCSTTIIITSQRQL